ncbi:hypothetical protein ACP4OV_030760 [Aristida adscensionis]
MPPPAATPQEWSRHDARGTDAAAPPPTISATILANLPAPEREVYRLVFAAGSDGMWLQDLRAAAGLSAGAAARHTRSLAAKGLLKEVPDARHRRRKTFMATDFMPSAEITGGTWYHAGRLDADAVAAARRRCLAQVERLGAATAEMVHHGVGRDEPAAGYALDEVRDVLRTMVLDKVVEEAESTGVGEFAAVESGRMCYKVAGGVQGGMMEGMPCGVCPRIDECSPEGVISPSTCVYYHKWLRLDF